MSAESGVGLAVPIKAETAAAVDDAPEGLVDHVEGHVELVHLEVVLAVLGHGDDHLVLGLCNRCSVVTFQPFWVEFIAI